MRGTKLILRGFLRVLNGMAIGVYRAAKGVSRTELLYKEKQSSRWSNQAGKSSSKPLRKLLLFILNIEQNKIILLCKKCQILRLPLSCHAVKQMFQFYFFLGTK